MKMILPALCFYWLDGPWRAQWNKFGFDPTKNASAKIYQTLDFRVRTCKSSIAVTHVCCMFLCLILASLDKECVIFFIEKQVESAS